MENKAGEVPLDLGEIEYARHLCEEILGWPAKTNLLLLADCIQALTKSKRLRKDQAYKYLVRAVTLAKAQGVAVNRFFFLNGTYTTLRPKATEAKQRPTCPRCADNQGFEWVNKYSVRICSHGTPENNH